MGTTEEENEKERGDVKAALRRSMTYAQALLDYMREAEQDGMCPVLWERLYDSLKTFNTCSSLVARHTDHVLGLGLPTTQDVKARNRRDDMRGCTMTLPDPGPWLEKFNKFVADGMADTDHKTAVLERTIVRLRELESEIQSVLTGAAPEPAKPGMLVGVRELDLERLRQDLSGMEQGVSDMMSRAQPIDTNDPRR